MEHFFQLVLGHPSFAWLRDLSRSMAHLNWPREDASCAESRRAQTASLRTALVPRKDGEEFNRQYHDALEREPDAALRMRRSWNCSLNPAPARRRVMKARYLMYGVLRQRSRIARVYRDLLGFKEVGRIFNGAAAALTSGRTHHELHF